MCGIYSISISPENHTKASDREFWDALRAALVFEPPNDTAAVKKALMALNRASFQFLRPGLQIDIINNSALRNKLSHTADELETWLRRMVKHVETGALTQTMAEDINFLITVSRDIVWRIKKDILLNADKIPQFLNAAPVEHAAFTHAWHLNQICNNINRLEVRGRDSAGIGVYMYFASADDRTAFLANPAIANKMSFFDTGAAFGTGSVVVPKTNPEALLFAFKVAREVGEMGDNVNSLREQIKQQDIFQRAIRTPGARMCALAHTRWASNGVICVPNCHPVDSAMITGGVLNPGSRGNYIAALNGDIDNFQELRKELSNQGVDIPDEITTDAKIIPLMTAYYRFRDMSVRDAFDRTIDRATGSMAIALLSADRPGEIFLAQKGSGQGLFLGLGDDSVSVASEMYGIVELTDRYVKVNEDPDINSDTVGERIVVNSTGLTISAIKPSGDMRLLDKNRENRAEITTRDIDRGPYPRYLLKEINEACDSVRKTMRGKILSVNGKLSINLGDSVLDPEVLKKLTSGSIHRILTMGQGTAAVAAQGISYLLNRAIGGKGIAIEHMKATEISGHFLRNDMSDTLVIAVSQSGTTTDTNRTVELVKKRGAHVIGIVNRRNSDLVFKSDNVLYTSDGRDIEMSVASTKAFYSQNVAGQILALGLAEKLGTLSYDELAREIIALEMLPACMQRILDECDSTIKDLANMYAPRHRHWAIVGTGGGKIAADEIRIKLSELCYKAIAVDFLEDKKHIDLSSEPLILVCATGLSSQQLGDVVKEVSIFKAHKSVPLVITDEGEMRFSPYVAGQVHVPKYEGSLAYLLPVMVGHLFGFHAAESFEAAARSLRLLRGTITQTTMNDEPLSLEQDEPFVTKAMALQQQLLKGAFNSGLEANTAIKLHEVIDFILGRFSLDLLQQKFDCAGTLKNLYNVAGDVLSTAINELARPIDAIKHQAKTVTVGISRIEQIKHEGSIWQIIKDFDLPAEAVPATTAEFLTSFSPLISKIEGASTYHLTKLSPLGKPTYDTLMNRIRTFGLYEKLPSRYDRGKALIGTKRSVALDRKFYIGYGQTDQRAILIIPFITDSEEGYLLLIHFSLAPTAQREMRLKAFKNTGPRYDTIMTLVTEHEIPWSDDLLDGVDNDTLFLKDIRETAAAIVSRHQRTTAR
jgi:glutamine---fructose-6-phosphate transaminase (isomerizing)